MTLDFLTGACTMAMLFIIFLIIQSALKQRARDRDIQRLAGVKRIIITCTTAHRLFTAAAYEYVRTDCEHDKALIGEAVDEIGPLLFDDYMAMGDHS